MERVRRLMRLWPYLPAFRAVAETQHLPRASAQLFVSPSALSRSIRLLEEEVGVELFDRAGRQLELNASGQRFLSAVRDAMRLLDDGLEQVSEGQYVGSVRVCAPAPWRTEVVVPVLDSLRAEHPELVPVIHEMPADSAAHELLQGRLDVALVHHVEPHEDLSAHLLVELPCQLYCGPEHPLHGGAVVTLDTVEHAALDSPRIDPWPSHASRRVGLRGDLATVIAACETGRYVAALPESWAEDHPGLRALPGPELEPIRLYAVQRRSLGIAGRADAVIQALAEALGDHHAA